MKPISIHRTRGTAPYPRRRRRTGAAAVEFALVAPVIFTVFFGAIEIANLNFLRNMANDTAFQAARSAIVPGANLANIESDAMDFLTANRILDTSVVATDANGFIDVEVTIPIAQNAWGVAKFAKVNPLVQTCRLAKQVEEEE